MLKAEQLNRTFFDLDYDDPDMSPEECAQLRKEKSAVCLNDNYGFEMLCMLLDLTSARSGQQFIASPLLVSTLFQIFPRASTRMQDVLLSVFTSSNPFV